MYSAWITGSSNRVVINQLFPAKKNEVRHFGIFFKISNVSNFFISGRKHKVFIVFF